MSLYPLGLRKRYWRVRRANGHEVPLSAPCKRPTEFYDRYLDHLQWETNRPPDQFAAFRSKLMEVISESEMLYMGYLYCLWRGGRAPGHDTIRIDELSQTDVWNICRELAVTVRSGVYRPADPRICKIPKIGKSGRRPITIFNVGDRIVANAVALVLTRILDRRLSDCCFGRVGRGPSAAIAFVQRHVINERRYVLVCNDLKSAFHQIPRERLCNLLDRLFPKEVVSLVRLLTARKERQGVVMGSPISPALLHTYLDHFLDRIWEQLQSRGRLFRYVDDLLIACRSEQEAQAADATLRKLVADAGMKLKGAFAESIIDLSSGETAEWIGYRIWLCDECTLGFHIWESAWERLFHKLQDSQDRWCSSQNGEAIIRGWLQYIGPTFEFENRTEVLDRVAQVAGDCGYDDLPSMNRLWKYWKQGWTRFQKVLHEANNPASENGSKDAESATSAGRPESNDDEPF